MTFPLFGSPLRTDAQFNEMSNEEPHVGSSPLKDLSVDMITQFPMDCMHLVCLGGQIRVSLGSPGSLKIHPYTVTFPLDVLQSIF